MVQPRRWIGIGISSVIVAGWAIGAGCTSSAPSDNSTRTPTKPPTNNVSATRTRSWTPTPAAVTPTATPIPCNGAAQCYPTAAASGTQTPWQGGATIQVAWQTSGCDESPWYLGTSLDG